jgi:hypothetical protein
MSTENMTSLIDSLQSLIEFDVYRDINKYGGENNDFYELAIRYLRDYPVQRNSFLDTLLVNVMPKQNYCQQIKISEIGYDKKNLPFIEIKNLTNIPLDLEDLRIKIISNENHQDITLNIKLNPKENYLVSLNKHLSNFNNILSETGRVILSDKNTVIDIVDFNELTLRYSYQNVNDTWGYCTPTPGDRNDMSLQEKHIYINEFMADNDKSVLSYNYEYCDWIELYNDHDEDLDISHYYVTDDYDDPYKWRIPQNTIIPAKGFIIIWADDLNNKEFLSTNFKLSKDGEEIAIFDPHGVFCIDSISFTKQKSDKSFGREEDGKDNWKRFESSTCGKTNSSTQQNTTNNILLFPNPIEYDLYLDFFEDIDSIISISVYNELGQLVLGPLNHSFEESNEIIHLKNLTFNNGVYLLTVRSDKLFVTRKFVVFVE